MKWVKYTQFKRKLQEKNLSAREYEKAIKEYCEKNGL